MKKEEHTTNWRAEEYSQCLAYHWTNLYLLAHIMKQWQIVRKHVVGWRQRCEIYKPFCCKWRTTTPEDSDTLSWTLFTLQGQRETLTMFFGCTLFWTFLEKLYSMLQDIVWYSQPPHWSQSLQLYHSWSSFLLYLFLGLLFSCFMPPGVRTVLFFVVMQVNVQVVLYNYFAGVLLVVSIYFNYFMAVCTKPGSPIDAIASKSSDATAQTNQSIAADPNLRLCKRCNFSKPRRTHHCSMCNTCVLKMDHHCPWWVFLLFCVLTL